MIRTIVDWIYSCSWSRPITLKGWIPVYCLGSCCFSCRQNLPRILQWISSRNQVSSVFPDLNSDTFPSVKICQSGIYSVPLSITAKPHYNNKSLMVEVSNFCIPAFTFSNLSPYSIPCNPVTMYPCIPVTLIAMYPCIPVSPYPCNPVSMYPV